MRRIVFGFLFLCGATPLFAQMDTPMAKAAATITESDVRRRVGVIADDSMLGRDTPSPGLDQTARYVADQFHAYGLKPGGENGTWFQRYTISRWKIDPAASTVRFTAGGKSASASLASDARFAFGGVPAKGTGGPVFLLGGPLNAEAIEGLQVQNKVVVVVFDYSKPLSAGAQRATIRLLGLKPAGVVLLSNRDSASFITRMRTQSVEREQAGEQGGGPPIVEVHERAIGPVLSASGVDLAEIRGGSSVVARDVPGLEVHFDLQSLVLASATAPNTVGILEGRDPKLKNEYIVFSAHMDHIGITPGQPDSINNGADDDGSGTVGVVELAEAFSRKGVRPKRSLIFLTVSGEEHGLWGSDYFTSHPPVPVSQIVADINMDMIGRNWKDTIVAIGREHSDLGATLERVNLEHPELRMTAIDDRWPEENFYSRSDHFNFARKGIPILFFFNGVHEDYHRPSDEPARIDAEKEARILQLIFYLGQEIGNAAARPQWTPESYRKIVEGK